MELPDPYLKIACPVCGAPKHEPCNSNRGADRLESHHERWNLARVCNDRRFAQHSLIPSPNPAVRAAAPLVQKLGPAVSRGKVDAMDRNNKVIEFLKIK
jgi:hypothetical protein